MPRGYEDAVKQYCKEEERKFAPAPSKPVTNNGPGKVGTQGKAAAVVNYRKDGAPIGASSKTKKRSIGHAPQEKPAAPGNSAMQRLLAAANKGNAHSQFYLGYCYANGKGVGKDDVEAAMWKRRCGTSRPLTKGTAGAQFHLGECYENGRGVTLDQAEAVGWYRKAAEQGDIQARFRLALCYYNGWGAAQDYAEAVKWFRQAAAKHAFADMAARAR